MARVEGIGGVFFKSPDPKALADWYAAALEMEIEASFGGTIFFAKNLSAGAYSVWAPFDQATEYFAPSDNNYMINLVVDDLDQALAQVAAAGATVHGEPEDSEFGKFGWFSDPDGNKVELWQPGGEGASDD